MTSSFVPSGLVGGLQPDCHLSRDHGLTRRSARSRVTLTLFLGLLIPLASVRAADEAATIYDSGSTNTDGLRIVVHRSGKAECVFTPRRFRPLNQQVPPPKEQQLSQSLADRLFSDLNAAKPLSSLPAQNCMKSASFGTTRTIEFDGERTPDLKCGSGGDDKLESLAKDANEIVELFAVRRKVR